jgi:hypothetical protein
MGQGGSDITGKNGLRSFSTQSARSGIPHMTHYRIPETRPSRPFLVMVAANLAGRIEIKTKVPADANRAR